MDDVDDPVTLDDIADWLGRIFFALCAVVLLLLLSFLRSC